MGNTSAIGRTTAPVSPSPIPAAPTAAELGQQLRTQLAASPRDWSAIDDTLEQLDAELDANPPTKEQAQALEPVVREAQRLAAAEDADDALAILGKILLTIFGLIGGLAWIIGDETDGNSRASRQAEGMLERGLTRPKANGVKAGAGGRVEMEGPTKAELEASLPADLAPMFDEVINKLNDETVAPLRWTGHEGKEPAGFEKAQREVRVTMIRVHAALKKNDFAEASRLLQTLTVAAFDPDTSPAKLRHGMHLFRTEIFPRFKEQMRFLAEMQAAGIEGLAYPPQRDQLLAYFRTFQGPPANPQGAIDAYKRFSQHFLVHCYDVGGLANDGVDYAETTTYYANGRVVGPNTPGAQGVTTTAPTDLQQILDQNRSVLRWIVDCDGFAFTGATLLEAAGLRLLGYAAGTNGVGHSISALATRETPPRVVVINSGTVVTSGPVSAPDTVDSVASSLVQAKMDQTFGGAPTPTYYDKRQDRAGAWDHFHNGAHLLRPTSRW